MKNVQKTVTKSVQETITEFVKRVDEQINEYTVFKPSLFINIAKTMGLKCIYTHGIPYTGKIYEIYREVAVQGHKFKETVGHFKYVYDDVHDRNHVFVYIYDSSCAGGHNLNYKESKKYIWNKICFMR